MKAKYPSHSSDDGERKKRDCMAILMLFSLAENNADHLFNDFLFIQIPLL